MVTNDPAVFAAIADPTRRAILDALRGGERSAGDIAALFPVSRPAVSKHLRVLRRARLVGERKVAQSRLYSLDPAPLREVDRWLDVYRTFWTARLLDLKRYAESPDARTDARTDTGP
ncbi:MAG: winged helix-turn-helix transcriptional regulator [Gemmatirosa sp.]|nr:winged helix-turn-helix transcriptional regulator [Gemmatirosa sp.]